LSRHIYCFPLIIICKITVHNIIIIGHVNMVWVYVNCALMCVDSVLVGICSLWFGMCWLIIKACPYFSVPPTIEDGPNEVVATINTRTMLMCESLGLPEPKIKWEREGKSMPNSGYRYRVHRYTTGLCSLSILFFTFRSIILASLKQI